MFNVYPVINYDGESILDISKRFAIKNIDTEKSKDIYFWHIIKNWKSPENIAYDFYGSCDYIWVILALNNIVNPITDWLMAEDELKMYIEEKYGRQMYDIHHYEQNGLLYREKPLDSNGKIVTITNYEYEVLENEKKRAIKVLYPHMLSTIEHEVKALFK